MKRIAFMGFRHGHINDLYMRASQHADLEIVASCEEDEQTRNSMREKGDIAVTHNDYRHMLDDVECDIVAVGEYYGKRGAVIIEALSRGKHAVGDKPLCTDLGELAQISSLVEEKGLAVGCMLDLRGNGTFRAMRRLVSEDTIGDVQAISFGGQHPLCYGSRADWYFEEGKHGGTINDIAIHAIDALPWITGSSFTTVNAAKSWNGVLKEVPYFKDCGQVMMTMENGCGVLGDVSYLAPDSFGYGLPLYWRTTLWGTGGVLEASSAVTNPQLYKQGETEMREIPADEGIPGGYLQSFLDDIDGLSPELDTAAVLTASRIALTAQEAGDEGRTNVAV